MKMQILGLVIFFLSISGLSSLNGAYITKYDKHFKKAYNKYFYAYKPFYSYNIIKAQSIQESSLKQMAVSYVGASGLMQLMPGTYNDLKKRVNVSDNIFDVKTNIELGVYYDRQLFNNWRSKRPLMDRYKLTFASYNAGLGHILKAQKLCNSRGSSCNLYDNIILNLKDITGHHHKETEGYVKNIFKYYYRLEN